MSELTYDQIIFKASHNSYERTIKPVSKQLDFNKAEPHQLGCLSLEYDIWRHSSDFKPGEQIDEGYFKVAHVSIEPNQKTLAFYLQDLLEWHNRNPDYYPILITIDIKSTGGGYSNFHDEIDTYLKCYFDEELIFKPKQLFKNSSLSLCENVIEYGWPKLSSTELKGKFIFCLSGNKDWKTQYANTNLQERYCFSDQKISDNDKNLQPPDKGNFVFFNVNIFNSNNGVWVNTLPRFAEQKLIVRAYEANHETNWNNCIRANVSAIATNKIGDHEWCKVDNDNPFRQKHEWLDKRFLKNRSNKAYRTSQATVMDYDYTSPRCTMIFEKQAGENIYGIRNAENNCYFQCNITSMPPKISGDCQRWELITVNANNNEYYVKNRENGYYMTKAASKLSKTAGNDEVYIIDSVP
ncbi:MAG: Ca2+-dependent phosphoinositide-specific phospholipase C [Calothrix sp. MO_167.B12]|nr:Ca2+-dependent phosphoinositide-specific phospholipase C [Calothrix sp. MO_167.B12]